MTTIFLFQSCLDIELTIHKITNNFVDDCSNIQNSLEPLANAIQKTYKIIPAYFISPVQTITILFVIDTVTLIM